MTDLNQQVKEDMDALTAQWLQHNDLKAGDLVVVGCSTSEVMGEQIGTAGSEEIAASIFEFLQDLKKQTGVHFAFQCCEHLNRALVGEREAMKINQLEEVTVIPVPSAGGSMASYVYKKLNNPVVVESVKATAGIDIGETMIGMHLKHVAVPCRFQQRFIGNARVNGAKTRPKLIGGERATYERKEVHS